MFYFTILNLLIPPIPIHGSFSSICLYQPSAKKLEGYLFHFLTVATYSTQSLFCKPNLHLIICTKSNNLGRKHYLYSGLLNPFHFSSLFPELYSRQKDNSPVVTYLPAHIFLKETEQKKWKTTKINWRWMEFDLLIFDCKENLHGRWKRISLNIFKSGGFYIKVSFKVSFISVWVLVHFAW